MFSGSSQGNSSSYCPKGAITAMFYLENILESVLHISLFLPCQCINVWVKSIFAANGHTPVLVLPKAQKGICRKSGHHQGSNRNRKTGYSVENQSRWAGKATDQPASENGESGGFQGERACLPQAVRTVWKRSQCRSKRDWWFHWCPRWTKNGHTLI